MAKSLVGEFYHGLYSPSSHKPNLDLVYDGEEADLYSPEYGSWTYYSTRVPRRLGDSGTERKPHMEFCPLNITDPQSGSQLGWTDIEGEFHDFDYYYAPMKHFYQKQYAPYQEKYMMHSRIRTNGHTTSNHTLGLCCQYDVNDITHMSRNNYYAFPEDHRPSKPPWQNLVTRLPSKAGGDNYQLGYGANHSDNILNSVGMDGTSYAYNGDKKAYNRGHCYAIARKDQKWRFRTFVYNPTWETIYIQLFIFGQSGPSQIATGEDGLMPYEEVNAQRFAIPPAGPSTSGETINWHPVEMTKTLTNTKTTFISCRLDNDYPYGTGNNSDNTHPLFYHGTALFRVDMSVGEIVTHEVGGDPTTGATGEGENQTNISFSNFDNHTMNYHGWEEEGEIG